MTSTPHQLAFVQRLLLMLLLTAAAAGAQRPANNDPNNDPIAKPIVARVVSNADGMPRSGVLLHITQRGLDAPRIDQNGCLIAEDLAVRQLRAASTVRTGPDGRATLRMTPKRHQLRVGQPFFTNASPEFVDGEWLVKVGQHTPVRVRAVGADGKVIAGLAVALHSDGKDIAVALTDKAGRAVLGVPKAFTARATIAPAGWVGPKETLPWIAGSAIGRHEIVLQVPLHGTLAMRRVRGGSPQKARISSVDFFAPEALTPGAYDRWNARPQVSGEAIGIIFPMVAVGQTMSCYTPFQGRGLMEIQGPQKAGEACVVDVELGAKLTMRIAGVDAKILVSPNVRAITDIASNETYANRRQDNLFEVDFRRALAGSKLIRVEIDTPGRTAVLRCDRSLRTAAIDLGTVELNKCAPQLAGIVVDPNGKPLAGIEVVIASTNKPNTGYIRSTDATGRFLSSGPVQRDENGNAVRLTARLRSNRFATDLARGVDGKVRLVARPVDPANKKPAPVRGTIVARLVPTEASQQLPRLTSRFGIKNADSSTRLDDGTTEVTFDRLRPGSYSLLTVAGNGLQFVVLDKIEVTKNGSCDDPRLQRINCNQKLRKLAVRVVNQFNVPIAGARIQGSHTSHTTDGTGTAVLYLSKDVEFNVTIAAPGMRTQRRTDWASGLTVTLEPESFIKLRVVGLPPDVPRDHLEVWLRDEVRARFGGPRGKLGDDDTVTLPLPHSGGYLPSLLFATTKTSGSKSWSTLYIHPKVVAIDKPTDGTIEMRIDAATVERLRKKIR